MTLPSIPLDIIDNIIEKLSNDEPSLTQCATVSRDFLHSSRKRLYRHVVLGYARDQTLILCAHLFSILSDVPEVASYIHSFAIIGGRWTLDEATLPPVLCLISEGNNLQKFSYGTLDDLTWDGLGTELRDSLLSLFRSPSLSTIKLFGSITGKFPTALFATVPALKHIAFSDSNSKNADFEESLDAPQPFLPIKPLPTVITDQFLEILEVYGQFSVRLLKYLSRPLCPIQLSRLRKLWIRGSENDFGYGVSEVMKVAAGSLEELVWDNWLFGRAEFTDVSHMNLRAMKRLQRLEFRLYPDPFACEWAVRALTNWGLPDSLLSVIFLFDVAGYHASSNKSMKDVDVVFLAIPPKFDQTLAALCDPNSLPNLAAIEIKVSITTPDTLDAESLDSYVGKWFPQLQATGYLRGGLSVI